MFDLKAHVLHGKSFHVLRGPILIPPILLVIAITVGSFFLNAVFAFAVSRSGRPEVQPGDRAGRNHVMTIVAWRPSSGMLLLDVISTRWGKPWFTISLGIGWA